jgi:pyruvate/2-oxoglutarate dehydrogenase complex dihydrolipoamide dehydrogenase (E3) component
LTPDLCVVGAGAAGLAVARAARRLGASVVVVEKGSPGGMSLKAGALALSALAAAAETAAAARAGAAFGVFGEPPKVSFRKVHDHVAEIIGRGRAAVAPEILAAAEIALVRGTGAFADAKTLTAGDMTIRARRFVIATGARPVLPDIPGLFSVPYFTTETIFDNTRKLTHLVVIGAGPMGLELALSYRRLGCEVTVVEPGRALPAADPELAGIALRRLREEGVALREEASVVAIKARSQGIGVILRAADEQVTLDASHILVAAARTPNLAELNLEAAKIRRARGDADALALDASLRTSNPRVFAVGEAAGQAPAPHIAAIEAELVARAALRGRPARYDPAAVPRLTLTDPPIAEIGLSEAMARHRIHTGFSVLRASYADNDLARARRAGMGVVKLIVAPGGHLLGAGCVGAGAGELVALLALVLAERLPVARLAELAAPYPGFAGLVRALGEQAAAAAPARRPPAWRLGLDRLLR